MKEAVDRGGLRCRRSGIEKLGNGSDKLRGREGFGQENAVGTPFAAHLSALAAVM
jgi:hypothetical protein